MENNTTSAPVQGSTKKGLSAWTIIFLVTTLGFGGAFAWAMLNKGDSNNNGGSADIANQQVSTIPQEQLDNPTAGSIAEVVSDFNTDKEVRDLVRELKNKTYEHFYVITSAYDDGVDVFGNDYRTRTSKSYGFYTLESHLRSDRGVAAGSSEIDYARKDIVYILEKHGFAKDEVNTMPKSPEYDGGYNGYYRKDDLVCEFSTGAAWVNIDCASTKWFTAADKEFADAVAAARGYGMDNKTNANTNVITTTEDGKYEKASVSVIGYGATVGGHVDLFYRKVDGGEWTYVTSTQGAPSCNDFTGDAIEAYKGTLCSIEIDGVWQNKNVGD